MSKVIYVCARNGLPPGTAQRLRRICENLAPDNITPRAPKVLVRGDVAYGIMNPQRSMLESGSSVLIGHLFEKNARWADPSQRLLDGSFVLFRDGDDRLEIRTDLLGSRALWTYLDDELFIASTSQRAMIIFLGSFEFDDRLIPWMLSTGTLGPSHAWDRRIRLTPADSAVILDKKAWVLSTDSNPIEAPHSERSDSQHEERLWGAVQKVFETIDVDFSTWVLPLSGGYDSRSMLWLFLKYGADPDAVRTITWGQAACQYEEGNEPAVAREVAEAIGVSNTFYPMDLSDEPMQTLLDRFILLGEGRTDRLSGYMDGFGIWKTLFEEGVEGSIRGDEAFGMSPLLITYGMTRRRVGCGLCSDFANLKDIIRDYGLAPQELPERLQPKKEETLDTWRDRAYRQYRVPIILSSLSDLKLPFGEIMCPLFSRKIVEIARQLPDHLRNQKTLYRKITGSLGPPVPYSTRGATPKPQWVVTQDSIKRLMVEELSSIRAGSLFPAGFADHVLQEMETGRGAYAAPSAVGPLRAAIRQLVPKQTRRTVRETVSLPGVDPHRVAFRVYLVSRMNAVLNADTTRVKD